MDFFCLRDGEIYAEDVPLAELAELYGTPLYVYSAATLDRHWHAFDRALEGHEHLVCYAVKANSNLAILQRLARLGSGFDIVSVGELERVLKAGGQPGRIVFSGVGKRSDEIRRALEVGIRCFNVESEPELDRLAGIAAAMGRVARVSLRINPDVDARTHPYISTGLKENKFGIDVDQALAVYRKAAASPHLEVSGMDCHIGSQLTSDSPYVDALARLLALVDRLQAEGIRIHHVDVGGGLGIRYRDETPPEPAQWAAVVKRALAGRELEILVEPGRAIAGNAGLLLTRVEYLKHTTHKDFALVDAAMNDLMRPALYSAWQEILPVRPRQGPARVYDVVGPVCETADFLGKERELVLEPGDLLAIRSAGAYGFVMSSNYNTRPRAAEVLVEGSAHHLVRERESIEHLFAGERLVEPVDVV